MNKHNYKQALKDLVEQNSLLNDKLYSIDKAVDTRDTLLSIIGDIALKVKGSPDGEAKKWYVDRLAVLMKCLNNVEWMTFEIESQSKTINYYQKENDTLLLQLRERDDLLDMLLENTVE